MFKRIIIDKLKYTYFNNVLVKRLLNLGGFNAVFKGLLTKNLIFTYPIL
jgi:hypothetical protein